MSYFAYFSCDAPAHGTVYHDLYDHIKAHIDDKKKKMNVISFLEGLSNDSSEEDADDEVIGMKDDGDNDDQDLEKEEQMLREEFDIWPDKHPKDPKHEVCT